MAKHIHIYLPARTRDATWEEGKHPRKEDGKFGTGGGEGSGPAHHKAGSTVYTSNRSAPRKATVLGPDPDSKDHLLVQTGNSKLSVPKSQVHASKEDADKEFK